MPQNPIGITFLPSQDAQAMGPRQGQMEGDLAQAFKILSLRLPEVLGAGRLGPRRILPGGGGGSAAVPNMGASPYAAVFEALLRAQLGGGQDQMPSFGGDRMPAFPGSQSYGMPADIYGGGGGAPDFRVPPPVFTPGDEPGRTRNPDLIDPPVTAGAPSTGGGMGGDPEMQYTRRGRGSY